MSVTPFSEADHLFMARALQLAERGLDTTTPNPRVGCVLVKDGAIIGEGFHARAGGPHAEVEALRAAGDARGATAYVTLEPCSHHGRTPPCADALIAAGVARVVAAMSDPNPKVAGSGIARLQAAGILAQCGLLEDAARELNLGFISRMTRGRPWVRVKIAASLDGGTALANGESQWITGDAARRDGHRWRARACAILTGSGTLLRDNPALTVREVSCERQPLRVIIDSRLETPPTARIFEGDAGVLIFYAEANATRQAALEKAGATLILCPGQAGRVDLAAMLSELGARGVNELHVEAGARLNGALLDADLIDELLLYFAPCLLGGAARGLFDNAILTDLAARREVKIREMRAIGALGADWRVLARILARNT